MRKKELRHLIKQTKPHKKLLFNKLTYVVVIFLVLSAGAQAYTTTNDDGQITGTVVDAQNEPVDNATVELVVIPLSGVTETETTTTGANGRFEFTREDILELRINVIIDGDQVYSQPHHLMYQGQNSNFQIELNTTVE